tara:strand:- start:3120 stop:3329 length:210 start_codon:yes stop_codon:yes gene_type:complete
MTPGYDAWRLAGPDEQHEAGTEAGDDCGRYAEPDGDAPRGYRPRPCTGTMNLDERDGMICCDTCGELGN